MHNLFHNLWKTFRQRSFPQTFPLFHRVGEEREQDDPKRALSFFLCPQEDSPGAENVCRLPKDPENHVGKPEKLRQEVAQERGGNHRQHNGQNHHRRARAFLFIAEFRAVAQILGNVKS